MRDKNRNPPFAALVPLALFLVAAAVYTARLSPNWGAVSEFNTWDGLEYTICATLLGIDHPPGNPLYLLLGKFVTLWPSGSPGRMINMISAISGALTIVFLYSGALHVMRCGKRCPPLWWSRAAAAALSLGFGFSYVFWSHCEIAEIHTLFTALLTGAIAALFRWQRQRRARWLNAAALLAGLAVGVNILATLAALPAILIFVWLANGKDGARRARLLPPFLIFLSGFAIYLYYPIRLSAAPFSHPMNLMAPHPPGSAGWYWWYISGAAWTAGKMFFLSRIGVNAVIYWRFLLRNCGIPMLVLACAGAIHFFTGLFSSRPSRPRELPAHLKVGLFLALLFAFTALPELSIHDPSNPRATDYLANFFLPSLLVIFYWVAAGLSCAYVSVFSRSRGGRLWPAAAAACLFAFPSWQFARNTAVCDLSGAQQAYLLARDTLTRLPEKSLVISKLVYPQIVTYFSRVEQIIGPERCEVVNPDVEAASIAREPAPSGCSALFARRHRALLDTIEQALADGRPVFLAGDAVEMDKSPERMLMADLVFAPWPPPPHPPGAPRELFLYRVERLRKAVAAPEPPLIAGRGIANDGAFSNGVRLRGYARDPAVEARYGGLLLLLDLVWETRWKVSGEIYVVVTVLDARMKPVPGAAIWYALGGAEPPVAWRPGKAMEEEVTCLFPPLPPGTYYLALGLVDCNDRRISYLPSRPPAGVSRFDYVLVTAFRVPRIVWEAPLTGAVTREKR